MPFIPHTRRDTDEMLRAIGVDAIDELFDEIPDSLRCAGLELLPDAMSEQEVGRLMRERSARDEIVSSFLGAGAYEHHIPAAVWDLVSRGEALLGICCLAGLLLENFDMQRHWILTGPDLLETNVIRETNSKSGISTK